MNEAAEAPGGGFTPLFTLAAFSRAACSFCAFLPSPPTFTSPALGMKSLIQNPLTTEIFSNALTLFFYKQEE
ncbi:MAG: hypothetical protein ABI357_07010, partial [Granulicella sp.]